MREHAERYGQWAGNERGHPADKSRCCEEVMDGWHTKQCSRPIWRDNHCKQHHPDTVEQRMEEGRQRQNTRIREEFMRFGVKALVDALIEIESGHNDPRSLAKERLDTLRQKSWWKEPE